VQPIENIVANASKSVSTYTGTLPKPQFSRDNPYWRGDRFSFIVKSARPRYSALDFLYATVWEINRQFDTESACFIRHAVVLTAQLNSLVVGRKVREQFRNKEMSNEKST
jgi:hypothetical protein